MNTDSKNRHPRSPMFRRRPGFSTIGSTRSRPACVRASGTGSKRWSIRNSTPPCSGRDTAGAPAARRSRRLRRCADIAMAAGRGRWPGRSARPTSRDQRIGCLGPALIGPQRLALPFRGGAVDLQTRTRHRSRTGTSASSKSLLNGKVLTVSHDAIARDKPQERLVDKPQGAEASSSEPKGQELIYAARVSLDRTQMEVENKRVNLSPGMAVTVEIKTGARSIISYLLSPLIRYKHESLRER